MATLATRIVLAGSGGKVHKPVPLGERRPTVSVVIPCYNYGHYLDTCVGSVLDQPGIDVEVIIVDDCSPDGSGDVAEELARRDSRVRVIRHPVNTGHIRTYNDGLWSATGTYVTLVSADDLVAPGALSRAAALMEAHPTVGFTYGACVRFTSGLPEVRSAVDAWITWSGHDWLRLRCRSGFNVIASPEVVMRTALLRKIGGYREDLPHSGDFEMWLRASSQGDVGYVVGADQAMYRVHESNMHKTMFDSGNVNGQFIDLKQRAESFTAVFDTLNGNPVLARLERRAARTLATEAVDHASYAFARGFTSFPVARFEDLAYQLDPSVGRTGPGRGLQRRKALGMSTLRVNPLWAPYAVKLRVEERARRWRRARVGI